MSTPSTALMSSRVGDAFRRLDHADDERVGVKLTQEVGDRIWPVLR